MAQMKWKAWGVAAASSLLAIYAFGLVYEGFVEDHYSGALTYPFVDEAAAWRAYRALPATAPLALRERRVRRLVEADPADAGTWTAVSYLEFLKGGRMTPAAVTALDHGYALSFFDRRDAVWRIGFALENWSALPVELRKDVLTEAAVALKDPALADKLKARLKAVSSPEGRLAALMVEAEANQPAAPPA